MAHRELVSNNFTSLNGLIKLIVFLSFILFASYLFRKPANDGNSQINSSSSKSGQCSEYNISPFFKRRFYNRAVINQSTNGCVAVDLMGESPFTLEFAVSGPPIHFSCAPLPNSVLVVALKCPGMQVPFTLDPNKSNYSLGDNCGLSPLKIYGAGRCVFKLKK